MLVLSLLIATTTASSSRNLRGSLASSMHGDCRGPFPSEFSTCEGRIVWLTQNYLSSPHSRAYIAAGVDGSRCSAQHFLSTVESFCPRVRTCSGPFPAAFSGCEGRIVWLTQNYLSSPHSRAYIAAGVDGTRCSAQHFLSTQENHCPPIDADSHVNPPTAPTCGNPDSTSVVVATQNLFWWNLFGQRNGANFFPVFRAHGPFDILLLQECDDVQRIVDGLGLGGCFAVERGRHAVSIAWNAARFERMGAGSRDVGEDRRDQFFGSRGVVWVRLRERASGAFFFAVSHHGPLPVNTGGRWGGSDVAARIKAVIAQHAGARDTVLLGGDFNADPSTSTVRGLEQEFARVRTDWVDHMFVRAVGGHVAETSVIRGTGSDHRGIKMRFKMTQ